MLLGGAYAYGAYGYPYSHPYNFHNSSGTNTNGTNTTLPVECVCAQYQECGCDDNTDSSYLDQVVGNGTISNGTLASVQMVNGTKTLVINGTLPNGTTASGGSVSANAAVRIGGWGEMTGYWMMLSAVAAIVLTT